MPIRKGLSQEDYYQRHSRDEKSGRATFLR